ncbi:hypothetical protein BC827DRAFT_1272935 [Russula dissimulans]|nr:hypothetical protein BC827DRAFT_1272935 [Russula dissimulans]
MYITSTPEWLGEADALLKEAGKRLEEHRNTLDLHNYVMAQEWLTIANVYRVGLEDRNVFGRLQQAQIYLDKAQETHGRIKLLIADWDVVC